MKFCNSIEYLYLTVHVDNSWYYVKGEHIQFHNVIVFFFFLEADQHENLRQEVVRKRRGFDSVVKYTSVFDWRTVWTFCRNKLYGMTILAWKLFCRENQSFLFSGEAVEHFFLLLLGPPILLIPKAKTQALKTEHKSHYAVFSKLFLYCLYCLKGVQFGRRAR